MPVSNFVLPTTLDGDLAVLSRIAAAFAPHETTPPSMSITLDAGHFVADTLIEVAAQTVGGITAPTANPRIDRIIVDQATGAASIITGTESASPVPPPLPAGAVPIARVLLSIGLTAISNAIIVDERDLGRLGQQKGVFLGVQRFTSNGTYVPTPGTTSIVVDVVGGGGSGGGCASNGSSQGSASGAGSAGAFARARLTSGFSSVAVTVGAGGAATAASAVIGNAGGSSSFGSLIVAPGGSGGYAGFFWLFLRS